MTAPREFWIHYDTEDLICDEKYKPDMESEEGRKFWLHVVEYNAYDAVVFERDACKNNALEWSIMVILREQELAAVKSHADAMAEALKAQSCKIKAFQNTVGLSYEHDPECVKCKTLSQYEAYKQKGTV